MWDNYRLTLIKQRGTSDWAVFGGTVLAASLGYGQLATVDLVQSWQCIREAMSRSVRDS